jgi:Tol biopolymer transport system component
VLLTLPAGAGGTSAAGPTGTIAVAGGTKPRTIYVISPASGRTRTVRAPDVSINLDLSPDGARIAIAGSTGLWVMNRDGSRARRIGAGAGDVVWSPGARRLAIVRDELLLTVASGGGRATRVTAHAEAPDWWPDGKRILFVRNPERSSRDGVVSAIGAGGRDLRRIVANGTWYGPRVSPDGSRLAFYRNGVPGIYVASTRGGRPRLFIRNGTRPEWSPDGRYLAFTRDVRCSEALCSGRIFVVPISGGKPRPYGPAIPDIGGLSWSR